MLSSRIISGKEPLHNWVRVAYVRHIRRIRYRQLHVSSVILNSGQGKHVQQSFNVTNLFYKEKQNTLREGKEEAVNSNKNSSVKAPFEKLLEDILQKDIDLAIDKNSYLVNIVAYYKDACRLLDRNDLLQINFTKQPHTSTQSTWLCNMTVKWPEELTFTGEGITEYRAGHEAAGKCMYWLIQKDRVFNNKPLIYTKEEFKQILRKPVNISIDESMLPELEQLVNEFDNEVRHLIEYEMYSSKNLKLDEKMDIIHDIFKIKHGVPSKLPIRNFRPNITSVQAEDINNNLLLSLCDRHEKSLDLPIFKYRDEIINALENTRVLLIKGHTGCGKSTQVPQFIMDSFIERLQGTNCHIIISQPRRIAAISLAQRVASERNVTMGDTVGYQVRLDEVLLKRQYGMQFCTIGILLNILSKNPDLIGVSHVIVDEIHERDANVDISLALLKQALTRNPSLKIILMSASINTEMFQKYFDCSVIEVPGTLYPVEMNFLDDIVKISPNFKDIYQQGGTLFQSKMIAELIRWIDKNQPPGAILCFLPGWAEICIVQQSLADFAQSSRYRLLTLHSMLPHNVQCKVFDDVPENVRKIILSTDIAETSITITDVVYVVDSAIAKVQFMVDETSTFGLKIEYTSKSSITQRKGRAGRVRSGVSYHIITQNQYKELPMSPVPEILRIPLEGKVLNAKLFSDKLAIDFFKELPEPPQDHYVNKAVENLREFRAIDVNEKLTPLGTRLLSISTSPMLGKALIYAIIFECLTPMLMLTTSHSIEEVFQFYLSEKTNVREQKKKYHDSSDHIAMYRILDMYVKYLLSSQKDDVQDFCYATRLNENRMEELFMTSRLRMTELKQSRMIEQDDDFRDTYAPCEELLFGLILAATNNLSFHIPAPGNKAVSDLYIEDIGQANIAPVSVNFNKSEFCSPYFVSFNRMHCTRRRRTLITDTSVMAPLTVFLFSNGDMKVNKDENYKSLMDSGMVVLTNTKNDNINICMKPREAELLLQMRTAINDILWYYIHVQGHELLAVNQHINKFKTNMLRLLCRMLDKASTDMKNKLKQ